MNGNNERSYHVTDTSTHRTSNAELTCNTALPSASPPITSSHTMSTDAPETNGQAPPPPTQDATETQPTADAPNADEEDPVAPGPELRMPTRKDVSLRELLNKIDDYAPIVRQISAVFVRIVTNDGRSPMP